LRLVALNESCDAPPPDAPLSFTFDEDPPRAVIAVSVPDFDPVVVLVNTTWNLADWPGPIAKGVESPEAANSTAVDASWVIVTVSLPVFVSTAVCVAFCPRATLGKIISDGEICTAACGVGFAFDVFASPAQPLNIAPPHASIANIAAIPHTPCLLAPNSSAPFAFAALTLAISSPPDRFVP
jgi:hypothetical protein